MIGKKETAHLASSRITSINGGFC